MYKREDLVAGQPKESARKKSSAAEEAFRLGQQAAYLQTKLQTIVDERQKSQMRALEQAQTTMQNTQMMSTTMQGLQAMLGEARKIQAEIEAQQMMLERQKASEMAMIPSMAPADMLGGLPPLGEPPAGPPMGMGGMPPAGMGGMPPLGGMPPAGMDMASGAGLPMQEEMPPVF